VCYELKKDVRMLKSDKQELEHANEILTCEKLKVDEKTLALCEDLEMLKKTMNMRDKVFNTNFTRLESESLQLKQRLESLVSENDRLREKYIRPSLTSLRTGARTVPQKRLIS